MVQENSIQTSELKIIIDKKDEVLDLRNVIDTLSILRNILIEINKEVEPNKRVDIGISPIKKGSHEIIIWLQEQLHEPINLVALAEIYSVGKTIVSFYLDINKIKKFLKGDKPKSVTKKGDKVQIEKNNGDAILVDGNANQMYQDNRTININIENFYNICARDNKVEGLDLVGINDEVKIDREDFEGMAKKNEILEEKIKRREVIENNANLKIRKLIFESGSKWNFYYKGNKIDAKIEDKDFLDKIEKDQIQFSKHLSLDVQLKIIKEYDPTSKMYLNIEYQILNINKVYSAFRQEELF